MSRDYTRAKDIALGKVWPVANDGGDPIWIVQRPLTLRPELFEQMFKREFSPPDEILAHRTALSTIYDAEYEADRKAAAKHLAELTHALDSSNAIAVTRLLRRHPTADWLSHIFLSEPDIDPPLIDAIRATGDICREALHAALIDGRATLVTYTQLHDALLEYTERMRS